MKNKQYSLLEKVLVIIFVPLLVFYWVGTLCWFIQGICNNFWREVNKN